MQEQTPAAASSPVCPPPVMDKLTKRSGLAPGNPANAGGNGGNTRSSPASSTGSAGRPSTSQVAMPMGQNSNNNRGSQQRVPARQQQQPRQGNYGGRNGGSSKGGQQPQGLGGFRELGINGVEQGTRKHNYNHLINLSYGHRGEQTGRGLHHHQNPSYPRHTAHYQPHQPKYNKEQFLQANCQFVIKESGEYAVHHVDPDVLVDWNNIEIIKVYSHEELSCPICLHQPVAAKMTRCGHVYCWPCILHYLALSDAKWRKCPICYESVYGSELKSVTMQMTNPLKVGQDITMRLMVCERSSVWPFPVTEFKDRKGVFYNIQEQDVSLGFSKFLTIRGDQIQQEVLNREERELLFALETDADSPESCFIEDALKQVAKRLESTPPASPAIVPPSPELPGIFRAVLPKKRYASAFLDEESEMPRETPISPDSSEKESLDVDTSPISSGEASGRVEKGVSGGGGSQRRLQGQTGQPSFFYQAADGQHIYLHPLNVKMLVAQYGELSASPVEITSRVLEVESWSISESVRKRYRYLAHLPLTCVINLVELELKPPYVCEEILHAFEEEAQQRDRQRKTKLVHEERGQRDAENAFRKDIRGRISFSLQHEHFPDVGAPVEDSLDFASQEAFPAVGSEPVTSPTISIQSPITAGPAASRSFAQMLRQGKVQPQPSKAASAAPQPSTSRQHAPSGTSESGDADGDQDYHPAPDFHNTFSSGLDAAFHRMQLSEKDSPTVSGQKSAPGKGSKKKRAKGTLLFSTGSVPRV